MTNLEHEVMNRLRDYGPETAAQIAEALGWERRHVSTALGRLRTLALAETDGRTHDALEGKA